MLHFGILTETEIPNHPFIKMLGRNINLHLFFVLLFHGCKVNNSNMKHKNKSVSLFSSRYKITKVLCYDNFKVKSKNK